MEFEASRTQECFPKGYSFFSMVINYLYPIYLYVFDYPVICSMLDKTIVYLHNPCFENITNIINFVFLILPNIKI